MAGSRQCHVHVKELGGRNKRQVRFVEADGEKEVGVGAGSSAIFAKCVQGFDGIVSSLCVRQRPVLFGLVWFGLVWVSIPPHGIQKRHRKLQTSAHTEIAYPCCYPRSLEREETKKNDTPPDTEKNDPPNNTEKNDPSQHKKE